MTSVTDLTDEVLHRLIIIVIKKKKGKEGKNKYTANSYNIYITISVRCWKIWRRHFSVSGRLRGQKSSLVVPLVVVFEVLVVFVILVFVWGKETNLEGNPENKHQLSGSESRKKGRTHSRKDNFVSCYELEDCLLNMLNRLT